MNWSTLIPTFLFGLGALSVSAEARVQANTSATTEVTVGQAETRLAQATLEGQYWFEHMQAALNQLNYQASFITMQPSGLHTYRWAHSLTPIGNQIELIEGLNGPQNQAIRFNNKVTYLTTGQEPYSVAAIRLSGPIPAGIYSNYGTLKKSYNVVAVGGDRVVNREAQHVRIIPYMRDRYLYSLWIDRATGILLGINTYLPSGDLVEQILLTSLQVQTEPLAELEQVEQRWEESNGVENNLTLSKRMAASPKQAWHFDWLPAGFETVRQQQVRITANGPLTEHYLFSDGMVQFSVYINEGSAEIAPVQYESLVSMASVVQNNYAVTVVGRIPLPVAQQIASSVRATK